jgi:hypothetical protein
MPRKLPPARWQKSLDEIGGAIANINERIRQGDLELFLEDRKERSDGPAIAQIAVGLRKRGEDTKKRLAFNVNAFGLVQFLSLIPHNGPKIADFNIADAEISQYEVVLVEFLDHCIPTKERQADSVSAP